MAQTIWTVSQLTRYLREQLEQDPQLSAVWVRGEISNFVHHPRGHMYFTLKDEASRIRCVMFASANRHLRFRPENGMGVLLLGYVSLFERDGQLQVYVLELQPDGAGSLAVAFAQLKERLAAEGLFDPRNKKPLPPFPKEIGVITSPVGAAIRDILATLQRRFPLVRVWLYPVAVQGSEAVSSICAAIEYFNREHPVDLLIVGRGGGSLEELWAFNEEAVARSIFSSSIPIISAVGHETDVTIADFVADVRAATPTAAAELAVPHWLELEQRRTSLLRRSHQAMAGLLKRHREQLKRLQASPLFRRPQQLLREYEQRLDSVQDRLFYGARYTWQKKRERWQQAHLQLGQHRPQRRLGLLREQLEGKRERLVGQIRLLQVTRKGKYATLLRQLDALSPLKVLQRGYAVVLDEEKGLIRSVRQVNPGETVEVGLADGRLDCLVFGIYEEGEEEKR